MRIDLPQETHYLKIAQVADRLGLSQSTVYKLCERKQLPSVRVTAKAIRVPSWVLDAYLKKLNGEAFSPPPLRQERRDIEADAVDFEQRTSLSPEDWLASWKRDEIDDTRETMSLTIRCLGILEARRTETSAGDATQAVNQRGALRTSG